MNEWEYIFEMKLLREWQKQLNQWRHDYDIEFIDIFNHLDTQNASILLKRKRKERPGA